MAIQKFELELITKTRITPNTLHFAFKRADGLELDFIPGQFVTFLFDHEDGKVRRRSYSVATIKEESKAIEVAVSYVEGGIASELLFNAEPGDRFNGMGPAGKLILKDDDVKRLILVGTGTGIAPYRSMLPELAKKSHIHTEILLGVQHQVDELYSEDFLKYAHDHGHINFTARLSRETSALKNHEQKGYVQHQFKMLNLQPGEDIIYLCGNPDMIDQAFESLTEQGFDSKSVRREKYISSN